MSIRVTKRDGSIVPIDVYKIKKVVAFGCGGTDCDPLELEMDAHVQFRDGITTEEIQKMVIQTAVEKITHENPGGNLSPQSFICMTFLRRFA